MAMESWLHHDARQLEENTTQCFSEREEKSGDGNREDEIIVQSESPRETL